MRRTTLGLTLLISASLLAGGCASQRKTRQQLEDEKARAAAAAKRDADANYTPGIDVTEAGLRGKEFTAIAELPAIYFEYDSSVLQGDNLKTLKNNAQWLKDNPDQEILVAGFCDERGTIEYNLALGQKRAKEVREYYIRLGVPGKRLATISYGKEEQVCTQATDDCWAQNRRAETRIRARMASSGAPKRNER